MGVRVIPAQMGAIQKTESTKKKKRVAAYARVSTDLEEQENSFEAQVAHYSAYITTHPSWELAGVYADEGISGTQTKKREQFNKMITDCENGEIDMVITKSISRFARNTLDCLKYIRKLKALNIPILFEKENINTMDASGELLITIMASIAQQESLSISQNVRLGHQYRFQQGKPLTRGGFMGYRMSKDKDHLVIEKEEAVIVRRIYREFIEGRSPREIVAGLEDDHIKSPGGKDHWHTSCIISMLKNEKYMGDLLLQKYYIKDFITKKAEKNNGVFPKYYVENAHQPIVPKAIFQQVQGEFLRRESEKERTGKQKRYFPIPLYDKITCAKCGNTFQRQLKNGEHTMWRCRTAARNKKSACDIRQVDESDVKEAVVMAFSKVIDYEEILSEMLNNQQNEKKIKDIQKKINQLHKKEKSIKDKISTYAKSGKLDNQHPSDNITDEFVQMKRDLDECQKEKDQLIKQKSECEYQRIQIMTLLDLIDDMKQTPEVDMLIPSDENNRFGSYANEVIRQVKEYPASCTNSDDFYNRTREKHQGRITTFNNNDVMRYIETIQIHELYMTVVFKAGIKIDIDK